jgi:hypothetical protein
MIGEIFIIAAPFVLISIIVLAIISQNIEDKKMENSVKTGDIFVLKDFTHPQDVNPFDEPSEDVYAIIKDIRKNEAGVIFIKYSYLMKNMNPGESEYIERLSSFLRYYEPVTNNK